MLQQYRLISGVKTVGLIDTGSMVTSISESFYDSMNPQPPLLDLKDFNLSLTVLGATGKGYIEAEVSAPSLGNNIFVIPVLVVNNTEYKNTGPSIIGTIVIRLCKQSNPTTDIPAEWQTAFDRMCESRKENPQKLTQLSSRSHPRHLVGKRTAQKDITIDTTSDSQVNSNFPNKWSPASLTFNNYFYLFLYLYIT